MEPFIDEELNMPRSRDAGAPLASPASIGHPVTVRLVGVAAICALLRWDACIDHEQALRASRARRRQRLGPRPVSR